LRENEALHVFYRPVAPGASAAQNYWLLAVVGRSWYRLAQATRERLAVILTGATFKDNLQQLPSIEGVERIDLLDANGAIVASIENAPGKQGSLAVYQYLRQVFGTLDAKAADHGLAVFAEHTADARNRPGAHPNIDRLLEIAGGGSPLDIVVVAT
jgi:hypothetical protein